MTEFYNEKVLENFKNPKNIGAIENPDGKGSVGNSICGDIMEISIRIKNNIIVDAKFKTFGCAAAIATSSMVTQIAIGKTIDEALNIHKKDIVQALGGLPPPKVHCSILGVKALKKAIEDFLSKTQ